MSISLFDVAGPIMVGPSSSHTAGACKIGQIARALFCGTPTKATFYLHGSFATVYQGHATDRALVAGGLKFSPSSPQIKDSFHLAEEKGFRYKFVTTDLGPEHHPNTVRIVLEKGHKKQSMIGSSIGGGQVKITHINDVPIDLDVSVGRFFTLLIGHENKAGLLKPLEVQLKEWHCPILEEETISVGENSLTLLNIDNQSLRLPQVLVLEKFPGIQFARALTKLLKY